MLILPPDFSIDLPGAGLSNRYGRRLLADLGATVRSGMDIAGVHPAALWAHSGLMALTGVKDNTPTLCPVPLASCADGVLHAFRALAATEVLPAVEGSELLVERAAIAGSRPSGARSPGGHCRLLATGDGMIALNLARDDDWELLPAWLGSDGVHDRRSLPTTLRAKSTASLVERGQLLGLAVVDAHSIPTEPCTWLNVVAHNGGRLRKKSAPRVLDLSSLWAGPLCSHLWQAAGADVTKVEASRRPDGARSGSREFFDLLHQGKRTLVLDLHTCAGQRELHDLIRQADIVLEGSRPRALRQMGIVAEEVIATTPGLSWVSITGYGRGEPQANWIAYGDDAGVAAGLSAILHEVTGEWLICGDAIADPLTGLHAAVAGWASWLAGGGNLLELSLEQTVRHCIVATAPAGNDYRGRQARWNQYLQQHRIAPRDPQRRREGIPSTP